MITRVCAHTDSFTMWQHGENIGLRGEALQMFKHAGHEIALDLDVDESTGIVKIIAVDGRQVAP